MRSFLGTIHLIGRKTALRGLIPPVLLPCQPPKGGIRQVPCPEAFFTLIGSCAAVVLLGSFIFGFSGVMAPVWRERLGVSSGPPGGGLILLHLHTGSSLPTGRLPEKGGLASGVFNTAFGLSGARSLVCPIRRWVTSPQPPALYLWARPFGTGAPGTLNRLLPI